MDSIPRKSIPETFAGADVFITGGSGFMGKVLIEKLLRSCPQIGNVFVLLRPRRGKLAKERVADLVQVPLFNKLREERPDSFQKIVPLDGDCSQLRLGLEDESIRRMVDVQFVFHAAASVRFDDPLDKALLLNTRGTHEVLRWAKTLSNLKAIVHISTTYSNPEVPHVEERIYPAKMDWRKAIEMVEKVEPEALNALAEKLSGFAPNTYTFTKGLAEQICYDYHHELPLVIFRPSIVINTETEPMPGWIENYNGPAGILSAHAAGILRTLFVSMDCHMNCIPADVSIKAIIVAAWKKSFSAKNDLVIYNSAAEPDKAMGYKFLYEESDYFSHRIPMLKMMWAPTGQATTNSTLFYLLFFLYQVIPAFFVDVVLRLCNMKPFLLKLQRSIFHAQNSLMYFTTHDWVFDTDNFRSLSKDLGEMDKIHFNIAYITQGLLEYCSLCMLGGRRYLFKESDDSIMVAFKRLKRFELADKLLKLAMFVGFAYVLRSYLPDSWLQREAVDGRLNEILSD
ncbi:putative fatty acyl-CoA reductase CG5065 [Aedes aegypti]|uniref:Fatty acyl-CoA reductase n=1 Tax=Aedes aegypti TaxID=7159 RepID=A0A1S4G0R7_AEDAE|nr:putative fatty acyl-CoA reductase CG5065 [Aedes aegypti]